MTSKQLSERKPDGRGPLPRPILTLVAAVAVGATLLGMTVGAQGQEARDPVEVVAALGRPASSSDQLPNLESMGGSNRALSVAKPGTVRLLHASDGSGFWVSIADEATAPTFEQAEHICLSTLHQPRGHEEAWTFGTGCSQASNVLASGQWLQVGGQYGGLDVFLLPDGIALEAGRRTIESAGGDLVGPNLAVFPLDVRPQELVIEGPIGPIDMGTRRTDMGES